ncbi:MAG: carboxylating nicotinate-nucleotide diphosphorylase [Sphingobacteriales bacterium]|nr:carboxylating nicotinate-nucleotide diphosphorylase [Sphingobacteriales bacterium]
MFPFSLDKFIEDILLEDIGTGDHSALSCIPATAMGKARLLVKDTGILAGVELAQHIFAKVDPNLQITLFLNDGTAVKHGDVVLTVEGSEQSILQAERIVLNCMQRMSAIATLTHQFVQAIAGTGARILDTRKTTPGFRHIEKWAVRIGGGTNHRFGLYDMIMIKDNHHDFCGGVTKAIERANAYIAEKKLNIKIEIEVRNLAELQEVLNIGKVDRIMFDNFTPQLMLQAVAMVGGRFETEASGGITLDTVRSYAETGVDFVSVGALTHSYKSMDLSLKAM